MALWDSSLLPCFFQSRTVYASTYGTTRKRDAYRPSLFFAPIRDCAPRQARGLLIMEGIFLSSLFDMVA